MLDRSSLLGRAELANCRDTRYQILPDVLISVARLIGYIASMRIGAGIALCIALHFGVFSAQAERRVALVIGNDTYAHLPDLNNAGKDARDMAAKLKSLGFEVIARYNASRRDMGRAIREFSSRLSSGGTGLAFFAGHGVQAEGRNYLIPANANVEVEADLEYEAVDANNVLQAMKDAGNPLNIFIIDACRDNPLPKRVRSAARGLAITTVPSGVKGTAILYAAGPGQTAQDGPKGGNGVFTGALLKHMGRPGWTLEQVFKATSRQVLKQTNNRQRPWQLVSLQGDFVFRVPKPVAPAPAAAVRAPQPDHTVELAFWSSVKDTDNPAVLEAYLVQYPKGTFAGLARVKIADLKAKGVLRGQETARAGALRQQTKAEAERRASEAEAARKRSEQQAARARERELWDAVSSSEDPAVVQAFLNRYPESDYAPLARARLGSLKTSTGTAAPKKEPKVAALVTPKTAALPLFENIKGNWRGGPIFCGGTSRSQMKPQVTFFLQVKKEGEIEGSLQTLSGGGNIREEFFDATYDSNADFSFDAVEVGERVTGNLKPINGRLHFEIGPCKITLERTG